MRIRDVEIRRGEPEDADAIALAHLDSIRSIGPAYYPPSVVDDWAAGLNGDVYRRAMAGGEVFFIATGAIGQDMLVLGLASDYPLEGSAHGTSVFVRGIAARRGLGSSLLRVAEAHARARGAGRICIQASLAGAPFYAASGYAEVSRGETRLMSGRPIACVFMEKMLA